MVVIRNDWVTDCNGSKVLVGKQKVADFALKKMKK